MADSDLEKFEDFFIHLPADPEEAYVVYHKRCSDELDATVSPEGGGWFYHGRFVDQLMAFDDVYALGLFREWVPAPASQSRVFPDFFFAFKRAADRASLKFRLERSRRMAAAPDTLVVLDPTSRKAIHQLIDALREELGRLTLSPEKHAVLFGKLNAFAAEVDQNLTRTEALFRFAAEIGRMAGQAADGLKPVTERIDRLLDMIDRATKWAESLPPWQTRKELPPPPKQIADGTASKAEKADNDIPF